MDQAQLEQVLSQIPPEILLAIIEMILNASPEELKELVGALQQQVQGGGQGQGQRQGQQQQQAPPQGGGDNVFG
jgi:hypothetical protein